MIPIRLIRAIYTLSFLLISFGSAFAQDVQFGPIKVTQNFSCEGQKGVRFDIKPITVSGLKDSKVVFAFDVLQNERSLNVMVKLKPEAVPYEPTEWKNGYWFCFSYAELSAAGDPSQDFTGVMYVLKARGSDMVGSTSQVFKIRSASEFNQTNAPAIPNVAGTWKGSLLFAMDNGSTWNFSGNKFTVEWKLKKYSGTFRGAGRIIQLTFSGERNSEIPECLTLTGNDLVNCGDKVNYKATRQ